MRTRTYLCQVTIITCTTNLSDLGTCGGIKADEFSRALRPDGSLINGLNSIGNNATNVFGKSYPGAGATIGEGIVFGYIAAQHIAQSCKFQKYLIKKGFRLEALVYSNPFQAET